MLDISSYRRKQKYALPLTVMRQFYYDYQRTLSIKHKQHRQMNNDMHQIDPLARQTLSIQKFQKCLNKLQNYQYCNSECRDSGLGTNRAQKKFVRQAKVNSTCERIKGKLSLQKKTSQDDEGIRKQSGYFKQMFSNTVAFLKCHPSIQKSKLQTNRNDTQQKNPIKSAAQCVPFSLNKLRVRNPTRQFLQMQEQKQNQNSNCIRKKNRLRKVRQQWVIDNLYKNSQNDKADRKQKSRESTFRVRNRLRAREEFAQTKQNIFPQ